MMSLMWLLREPAGTRPWTLDPWHDCLLPVIRWASWLRTQLASMRKKPCFYPTQDIQMPQSPSRKEIPKEANVTHLSLQSTYKVLFSGQIILIPKIAHNRNSFFLLGTSQHDRRNGILFYKIIRTIFSSS